MFTIFRKDFNGFFTNPTGYLVIGLFLLSNSLLLWYFKGNWNIFDTGFADLQAFFDLTPWIFIGLIPAISMRSFSDELNLGTMEILRTRPVTSWHIITGKFLAVLALVLLSLIPTFIYAYSIRQLAKPEVLDWAQITGSYIGLLLLATAFSAISIFASLFSKNQIVVLLIGIVLNAIFFYAFTQIQTWNPSLPLGFAQFGLYEHYQSISRGVIDIRNIVYFVSISVLFLYFSKNKWDASEI